MPNQPLIITTNDHVIAQGMDIKTRDPLDTRLKSLQEGLSEEVINLDQLLSGDEEKRLEGMEDNLLDDPFGLPEWRLGLMLGELVDQHRLVSRLRRHTPKVISPLVPANLLRRPRH